MVMVMVMVVDVVMIDCDDDCGDSNGNSYGDNDDGGGGEHGGAMEPQQVGGWQGLDGPKGAVLAWVPILTIPLAPLGAPALPCNDAGSDGASSPEEEQRRPGRRCRSGNGRFLSGGGWLVATSESGIPRALHTALKPSETLAEGGGGGGRWDRQSERGQGRGGAGRGK